MLKLALVINLPGSMIMYSSRSSNSATANVYHASLMTNADGCPM
jgi:hypothetical protein